jgi:hypothetical protein
MDIHRVVADPRVKEDRGRMAVERGPILFCCEWPDYGSTRINGSGHILGLLMDPKATLTATFDDTFFGGATIISGEGRSINDPGSLPRPVKLIPYHLWANRGAGEMTVWLSKEDYMVGDIGPAGGLIFFVNPNYASDGWRYLETAPCDQSTGAKWGSFRTGIPGARGFKVGTGKQNTMDIIAASVEPGSAATLCACHNERGITGWCLPSVDELALMYINLQASGIHDFGARSVSDNFNYWSSTQDTTDMAAHLDFADNGTRRHTDDKDYPRRVRAVRYL